jgi:hypothetical protein
LFLLPLSEVLVSVKKLQLKVEELKDLPDMYIMAKNFVAQLELRFASSDQQLDVVTLMFSKLKAEQGSWLSTYHTQGETEVPFFSYIFIPQY